MSEKSVSSVTSISLHTVSKNGGAKCLCYDTFATAGEVFQDILYHYALAEGWKTGVPGIAVFAAMMTGSRPGWFQQR